MSRRHLRTTLLAMLVAATTSGCGGGTPPSRDFLYTLRTFQEIASVMEFQSILRSLEIEHANFMCGYLDGARHPAGPFLYAQGRSTRFLIVTVYGDDIDKLSRLDLVGLYGDESVVPDVMRDHTPPFACDPLEAALTTRFGMVE